jgi:ELWxxDGT repeat protein
MPAKRSLTFALSLLLVAAIPARATGMPTLTVVDTINPGAPSSYAFVGNTARLGDFLYFNADDGSNGFEPWRTNGDETTIVADIVDGPTASNPGNFATVGDWVYFSATTPATGYELWRTNGTTTSIVSDIRPGVDGSALHYFTVVGDWLYFLADDGEHGEEVWRSNGTTTELTVDIYEGPRSMGAYYLAALDGWLYTMGSDGESGPSSNGNELWRVQGHTAEVISINPGESSSYPEEMTAFNGWIYFLADDGVHGAYEIFRTNGTTTTLVKDVNENAGSGSGLWNFTVAGDWLYFTADDAFHSNELWRTNGTTTSMVYDVNPDGGSNAGNITQLGAWTYFTANNGTRLSLWRTNGTVTEDALTASPVGDPSTYFNGLTAIGDYLYMNVGGTNFGIARINVAGDLEAYPYPGEQGTSSCECDGGPFHALDGRLIIEYGSVATGYEFAYLDEPTWVMPSTNRDGTPWSTALVVLSALTAAAGLTVRMRASRR